MVKMVLRFTAVATLAVSWGCDAKSSSKLEAPSDQPRGVLVISIDSLRADHLSSYGYLAKFRPEIPTSPNIDERLAEQGILFENALSTTSWTVPAHMAMLSGQPNEIHGVVKAVSQLPGTRSLLAQHFSRAGWRTAGFYSGPNLHPYFGFSRGFDQYINCTGSSIDQSTFDSSDPDGMDDLTAMRRTAHHGSTGDQLVERFSDWFEDLDENESFFAFVHFWDVHYDYDPPAEFEVFDPDYKGDVTGGNIASLTTKQLPNPRRDLDHIVALYDGEIRFTDSNVAKILDLLEGTGRFDNTIVVVVSDHGEEFGEHGRLGHNKTLNEEVLRVPLIMRYPVQIPANLRSNAVVSLVDLAPTIIDLCGFPAPPDHWGRSLAPLFEGDDQLSDRPAPIELSVGAVFRKKGSSLLRGIHAGRHKVILGLPGNQSTLFDLEKDPGELNPLIAQESDSRVKDARKFRRRLKELSGTAGQEEGGMPSELADELRAIGYLGDE